MKEPLWLTRIVLDAIHHEQVREHGGLSGLRDEGLLESALARPRHKWTYKRQPDLAALAAAYGYGIVSNHPFRDGNKRVGFLAIAVFLELNGFELLAEDGDVVGTMFALAAGRLTEAQLARWVRVNMMPTPPLP